MSIDIAIIHPPEYAHARAFDEVVETVQWGLEHLGKTVTRRINQVRADVATVLFGANLLNADQIRSLPDSVIIYNLEQVDPKSPWFNEDRFRALRDRPILWDYSLRNVEFWKGIGAPRVVHVPIGYAPTLRRLKRQTPDIEVLFYGSLNPRRQAVLDRLQQSGVRVRSLFGSYGVERDAMIARSKVVLNVHYYEWGILEVVRLSYLLANGIPIVSEQDMYPESEADLTDALEYVPYDQIVHACERLVNSPEDRERLGKAGMQAIQQRDIVSILRRALSEGIGMSV